jgi:hypothetical protein
MRAINIKLKSDPDPDPLPHPIVYIEKGFNSKFYLTYEAKFLLTTLNEFASLKKAQTLNADNQLNLLTIFNV